MIDKKAEDNARVRGDDIIAGRNAVSEALKAGRTIDSLYVARGNHGGPVRKRQPSGRGRHCRCPGIFPDGGYFHTGRRTGRSTVSHFV